MKYVFSYVTTEGAVRKVNQDSLFINTARFDGDEIFFAAVCDGVGGLSGGEKASAYVCKRMSEWFASDFADLMKEGEVLHHCVGSMGYDRKFIRKGKFL